MPEEKMTDEETAALTEMQADAPVEEAAPLPAPEPEKQEEPAPEPEFKSVRTDKPEVPEGFVPHQAMHAERMKRQAAEARLAELEAKQAAPTEAEPPFVDPLENPEGFKKWADHRDKKTQEALQAQVRERQEQAARDARLSRARTAETEFMAKVPDYGDAATYITQARVAELRGQGLGDPEISAQIAKDANAIFDAADAIGMNPAELLYYRAQAQGYSRKAPVQTGPSDADKIVALAAAQKATQGLGTAGGAQQSGGLTIEQLSAMSEAEMAKLPEAEIRRVMGG